ncbi:MAG: plasmid pRiA4b ORF-3 family protein [Sphingobacteriales bacterium]|jgi:hypothetical protein
MKDLLQIKISLDESDPGIWRRVVVHRDTTFFELHHIIQVSMGWQNYHMFEFSIEGYRIGMIYEDDELDGYGADKLMDSNITKLSDVLSDINDVVNYVYDFGDYWKHTLRIEAELDTNNLFIYPVCLAGEMACPPEDCGGLHGFYENLKILKDKKHPEYLDTKTWMPRGYDHQKFTLDKVNRQLLLLSQYIAKWLRG